MLDLKIETNLIEINENNKVFEDTEYANSKFKLFFNRMISSDLFHLELLGDKISKETDDEKLVSYGIEAFTYIFKKKLTKWDNIGKEGKKFPCNDKNKDLLIDYKIDFVSLAGEAYQTIIKEEEETKKKS